jgi:hypothetical protein
MAGCKNVGAAVQSGQREQHQKVAVYGKEQHGVERHMDGLQAKDKDDGVSHTNQRHTARVGAFSAVPHVPLSDMQNHQKHARIAGK